MSESIAWGEFVLADFRRHATGAEDDGHYRVSSLTRFNVPLYQRLYSWERSQVRQLLDDLSAAHGRNSDRDYYVGNLVLARSDDGSYDLIDGQQRMTTLWLILLVLAKRSALSDADRVSFNAVLRVADGTSPRLTFQIRDHENNYLAALLAENDALTRLEEIGHAIAPRRADDDGQDINRRLIDCIRVAQEFFQEYELGQVGDENARNAVQPLGNYILKHARLVVTVLPAAMDLNRYFEVMNNRGVQLEKHEILKALILNPLSKDSQELAALARIWDACSLMDVYLEDAFGRGTDVGTNAEQNREVLPKSCLTPGGDKGIDRQFAENLFCKLVSTLKQEGNRGTITLNNFPARPPGKGRAGKVKDQDEPERYRAILRFPVFLCHVLSLYVDEQERQPFRQENKGSFQDNQLLVTYERLLRELTSPETARRFIRHLFTCRLLFDHYVIKYRNIDGRSRHAIWRLKPGGNNAWSRACGDENLLGLSMLQAMLTVSMQDQFWLTPFLAYLLRATGELLGPLRLLAWLERLDNHLARRLLRNEDRGDFADRLVADAPTAGASTLDKAPMPLGIGKDELTACLNKGTDTARYWFFRLDYQLWKDHSKHDAIKEMLKKDEWAFQFRPNRSVEHVYPRHPDGDAWDPRDLDAFGNLALISVESNSAYSCQLPRDKRHDFLKRADMIESLKLVLIYRGGIEREDWIWGPQQASAHAAVCIEILHKSLC